MTLRSFFIILALLSTSSAALGHPIEASGIVRRVIDGCTFEVEGLGTVRLADVGCPPMGTAEGVHSREYSMEMLLNVQVFLDLDDHGGSGSVLRLSDHDGRPKLVPCYNRMVVDAGYGRVSDDPKNEFDPRDWWNTTEGDENAP
ncbi:MAG: hypothetical protein A4E51_01367 [Methanosaeta sp. PtaU1.Bin055]|nr:MAG: hypothetical protein A4E51_01367 [Methanosaeta sp. PtaU1.Bin055]